MTDALARAATLGPYFHWHPLSAPALSTPALSAPALSAPALSAPDGSDWRAWDELTDGDVLADRVAVAREALARLGGLPAERLPERAVASVVFLGYAARVVSPPLAAAALTGTLPVVTLRWRRVPAGPLPIGYVPVRTAPADAATLLEATVGDLLTPVLTAFRHHFRLSPQVLWGNVASALAGAAGMLTDAAPEAGTRAFDLIADALTRPPLAGTGTLVHPEPRHPRRFLIRHNCCLYYRIPGGGTCGDCILTPAPDRRRGWQAALTRPKPHA